MGLHNVNHARPAMLGPFCRLLLPSTRERERGQKNYVSLFASSRSLYFYHPANLDLDLDHLAYILVGRGPVLDREREGDTKGKRETDELSRDGIIPEAEKSTPYEERQNMICDDVSNRETDRQIGR